MLSETAAVIVEYSTASDRTLMPNDHD